MYQGQYYDAEIELAYNRFRYYDPEDGRYISVDPIGLDSMEFGFYNYVENPNLELDLFGLARNKYSKRTKSNLKAMRKRFGKSGRKKFLKRLGKDPVSLKKQGFSDADIKKIQSGKVPDGYVVHHKKPLYRGGNNNHKNLDLMDETYHQQNSKDLHYYPEGQNPYGLN